MSSATSPYDTRTLVEDDKAHFTHPWQIFDSFPLDGALPIARGEGCFIWDTDGNKYFDAVGGLWCNNIGLGRKDLAEAIGRQAYELSFASSFVDLTNPPAVMLAKKLAELAPGDLNHVFYTCGGSTANDTAYRLMQYYNNKRGKRDKKHVITRVHSYHGSTYIAMSLTGKPGDKNPMFDYERELIHHVSAPNYYRAPAGMSEADFVEYLVKEFEDKIRELGGADRVMAYYAEPVMGAGGVIVAPEGYNRRMWEVCQKYDILYVADEVVTAFGRLGHWFASKDVFDVQPDIIVAAKGISSGYIPLGACIYSDRIADVVHETGHGDCFTNGYTYSGHPVACAAALKNIEIMESEQMFANVLEVGPYFRRQLETLLDLPIVGEVRGVNFMQCVEFVKDQQTREIFPDELDIGKRVANNADPRGLIVRPLINLNIMSPPLIMTREQVDFVVTTLRKAILETIDELRAEGHLPA